MNKLHLKQVRIGFDLGDTLVWGDTHHDGTVGDKTFYPKAMQVVRDCVEFCNAAYIISKVDEQQRIRALKLLETSNFHAITGMPKEHVFFCARRDQKGIIARKLGLNAFVDDRPEVMAHMDKDVYRILFNPIADDVKKWKVDFLPVARDWAQVDRLLFGE